MLGVSLMLAYVGGTVEPGDDRAGSEFRWWQETELADEGVRLLVRPGKKWIFRRAIELCRLWQSRKVLLQSKPKHQEAT
ncbi:MAG: hypothetical protein KAJ53_10605 [Anaerolineales bacterium]|nr:hypothetical protein [Anaerolineales bacterium]